MSTYTIHQDPLHDVFDRFNSRLPFGFKVEWLDVVAAVDWCATQRESITVSSCFDNHYFVFEYENGYVYILMYQYSKIVATTEVADFLEAVGDV